MHSDLADLEAIAVMRRYYRWKRDLAAPWLGARVLEMGCGTGLFLEQLRAPAVMGIDCDPACVERARERLRGRAGAEVRVLDALDPATAALATFRPDTVVFTSSIEEMPDDALAVRHAAALLPSGGHLIIFAAAMPGLAGELDKAFEARRYRKGDLAGLFAGAGLRTLALRYVNLLGALGWWWDSRVVRRSAVSAGTYRARDAVVPFARLLDALTGPPVGRSLLGVARKP